MLVERDRSSARMTFEVFITGVVTGAVNTTGRCPRVPITPAKIATT